MAQANRVFRVFISSTFADLKAERDALQERVFPKLREHCAGGGYSFQAIDLRWGIGDEASAGQRTMRICLDEIARCQAVTPRPNFLLLLGDRYGWRPLPEEVPRTEFEVVRAHLEPGAAGLADTWYKLDTNAVPVGQKLPGVYRLQPRTAETEAAWDEAQGVLAPALRQAAKAAALAPDSLVKYTASATEQEILAGALSDHVEAKSVFAFVRTIDGLPESAAAEHFRDITPDGALDAEAAGLLADLKARLLDHLGATNVKRYPATWDGSAPSTDHIDTLCDDVFASLLPVINAEMDRLVTGETTTRPEEDAAHEAFREERGSSFTGQEKYLAAIATYLSGPTAHPLVVWGYGGSGKSALLAKAIEDARGTPDATLVHRFIGATPKSADIRSLLQDLFGAIGDAYGLEGEMPSDFNELTRAFRERLEAAGSRRPLLLFLDSLDQLSTTYGTHGFTWLPAELPVGVWIVTSIRADDADEVARAAAADAARPSAMGGSLGTLQRALPETALLELGPMSRSDAEELLAKWLALAERTLQKPAQWDAVLDSFARYDPSGQRGLPLHLRLAFERARTWASYDGPEGIRDKVRDMVAALYEHLEREHGPLLVGHTLAYLAATRNTMGLAEDEILDLLPADTGVFDEFRSRSKHEVAEGRIPVIVWSRLYFDLAPYLGTRSSEGASLLAFYHRELGEVAMKRYLEGQRKNRHTMLAAMFEKMADPVGDRSWTGRPRALAELPYHLAGAKDWDGVYELLTDFTFLEQKASKVGVAERPGSAEGTLYTGVYALLDDYENALADFPAE